MWILEGIFSVRFGTEFSFQKRTVIGTRKWARSMKWVGLGQKRLVFLHAISINMATSLSQWGEIISITAFFFQKHVFLNLHIFKVQTFWESHKIFPYFASSKRIGRFLQIMWPTHYFLSLWLVSSLFCIKLQNISIQKCRGVSSFLKLGGAST